MYTSLTMGAGVRLQDSGVRIKAPVRGFGFGSKFWAVLWPQLNRT